MSSPIVDSKKTVFNKALIAFHKKTAHTVRIRFLIEKFSALIEGVHTDCIMRDLKCLDVGCGDMTLAEGIGKQLQYTSWTCADIHELPSDLTEVEKWQKYIQFNGVELDFNDNYFDIVVMSDMLHHATENEADGLLREAARVGRYILIKDNFEYSIYSRSILRVLDFLGNYGYGISVPKKYYSPSSFSSKIKAANMKIIKMDTNIDFYSRMSILGKAILPHWQFIALLKGPKL